MTHRLRISLLALLLALAAASAHAAPVPQKSIGKVDLMPNFPAPYHLRDWRQVAHDYDAFVFDFNKTGDYLPLIWWDDTQIHLPRRGFGMPSYVGRYGQSSGNAHESINCMGAVLGATLAGIDKSHQWCPASGAYENWVLMQENYFSSSTGENIYLNNIPGDSGHTFWYEILPNIVFYQLYHFYPATGDFASEFVTVADRWYDACVALGGSVNPWLLPNFDYTAFDFDTMTPHDNGAWREPDAAAGVAYLQYLAYVHTSDTKYLQAADWCVQFLEARPESPLYDLLLAYAPVIIARMNAEQGRTYDLDRMMEWCFQGNRHNWGVQAHHWGAYDCGGLLSSPDYAFNMETLNFAGAIVPVARYDQGYARAIGKWMLNLTNSVRLFYPDALPSTHQTSYAWASTYDPCACIGYEGLKMEFRAYDKAAGENTLDGIMLDGNYEDTHVRDNVHEVLQEKTGFGGKDALEHIWTIPLTDGHFHHIVVKGHVEDAGDADNGFDFYYADNSSGPYTYLFNIDTPEDIYRWQLLSGVSDTLYVKVKDTDRTAGNYLTDKLFMDEIYVDSRNNMIGPYASGDPMTWGWGETDLGLYGSSYIGILGGIVTATNVHYVLQLDLLKTDYLRADAYPTFLYFNPHPSTVSVTLDAGPDPVDLYETVSHTFLRHNVIGTVTIDIPADSAVIVVLAPAGGRITQTGARRAIDGVTVDYQADTVAATCADVVASPQRLPADLTADCIVNGSDLALVAQEWTSTGPAADSNRDGTVDLLDLALITETWLQSNDP